MEYLNDMNHADVIVIGGGPAGIAAAITCVQGGLKVILLADKPGELSLDEAAGRPAEPLQSLHPGALSLLQKLQIDGAIAYSSKGTYTGIQTGEHISHLSTVEGEIWEGHHIAPSLFSSFALLKAKEFGIDLRFSSRANEVICSDDAVTGITLSDGTALNCKYLIDASGRNRFAGRFLKFDEVMHSRPLLSWTGVSMDDEHDYRNKQLAHFEPNEHGWAWTAYSQHGYHTWTKLTDNKNAGFFTKELAASPKSTSVRAANMQWCVFRPLACPGLLLAGDAAGILDPAAGQGILSGLMSGIMAGETVISCVKNSMLSNWHLAQYDNWFMTHYNHKKDALNKRYLEMGIDVNP